MTGRCEIEQDMGVTQDEFDPYEEEDEFEEALQNCGSHRRGQCDLLGTEFCDWSCPFHNEVFRSAINTSRQKGGK